MNGKYKENLSFNYIWQKYGTVGISSIIAILAILKPNSILDPKV